MKRLGLLAAIMVPLGLSGCTRDSDSNIEKRLDRIESRLASLSERAKTVKTQPKGKGKDRPKRPPRPRPNPNTTYSVPIDGSISIGPKHAKVTLIEGFEFA